MIMAPAVRDRKGEHQQVFEDARQAGFVRVRADGRIYDLGEDIVLAKNKRHSVEVIVDRLISEEPGEEESIKTRVADSVETALRLGGGVAQVWIESEPGTEPAAEERLYSEHFACVHCGISLGELEPRKLQFQQPPRRLQRVHWAGGQDGAGPRPHNSEQEPDLG